MTGTTKHQHRKSRAYVAGVRDGLEQIMGEASGAPIEIKNAIAIYAHFVLEKNPMPPVWDKNKALTNPD